MQNNDTSDDTPTNYAGTDASSIIYPGYTKHLQDPEDSKSPNTKEIVSREPECGCGFHRHRRITPYDIHQRKLRADEISGTSWAGYYRLMEKHHDPRAIYRVETPEAVDEKSTLQDLQLPQNTIREMSTAECQPQPELGFILKGSSFSNELPMVNTSSVSASSDITTKYLNSPEDSLQGPTSHVVDRLEEGDRNTTASPATTKNLMDLGFILKGSAFPHTGTKMIPKNTSPGAQLPKAPQKERKGSENLDSMEPKHLLENYKEGSESTPHYYPKHQHHSKKPPQSQATLASLSIQATPADSKTYGETGVDQVTLKNVGLQLAKRQVQPLVSGKFPPDSELGEFPSGGPKQKEVTTRNLMQLTAERTTSGLQQHGKDIGKALYHSPFEHTTPMAPKPDSPGPPGLAESISINTGTKNTNPESEKLILKRADTRKSQYRCGACKACTGRKKATINPASSSPDRPALLRFENLTLTNAVIIMSILYASKCLLEYSGFPIANLIGLGVGGCTFYLLFLCFRRLASKRWAINIKNKVVAMIESL